MGSPLVEKAVDFTTGRFPIGGETRGLEIWLVLVLHAAGLIALTRAKGLVRAITDNPIATLPGRSLATGLLAEHIRSLLPEDVDQATPEDRAALEDAKGAFEAVVREFLELEEPVPLPDGLPHDDLDIRGEL